LWAVFAAVGLLFAAPQHALAHASLQDASPSADAVVETAPNTVQLFFSTSIEAAFSKVRVLDKAGKQVDRGNAKVSGSNNNVLEVGLQPLSSGTYRVVWNIVSRDGHKANGEYSFTIL
jgi:methionine-rich copper-binding protein CopC